MARDKKEREERHIIREERLSRPEKRALEEHATRPGAEYVEIAWRKTASEDLHTIRRRIDDLIARAGKESPRRTHTTRGDGKDLPPGLRSRIVEAYGPIAHVRLAYTTKEHHVCRVGLREDGHVREIVVLVTPDDVRPVDSVASAVDQLPEAHPTRVRISRTRFDPAGHDQGDNLVNEWVELTNKGNDPIELTGWRLEDKSGKAYAFPEGFILGPKRVVKVRTGQGEDSESSLYWGRRAAVWNNQGDTASLYDADDELVDQVSWAPDG